MHSFFPFLIMHIQTKAPNHTTTIIHPLRKSLPVLPCKVPAPSILDLSILNPSPLDSIVHSTIRARRSRSADLRLPTSLLLGQPWIHRRPSTRTRGRHLRRASSPSSSTTSSCLRAMTRSSSCSSPSRSSSLRQALGCQRAEACSAGAHTLLQRLAWVGGDY